MKRKILAPLALLAGLAFGLQVPLAVQAAGFRPASTETITYDAGLEGSSARPIVGAVLAGRLRLTISPDGTIAGTYFPQDGNAFPVTGGLEESGSMWLLFDNTTIMGHLKRDGALVGSSFGPPAFDRLTFVAHPVSIQHSQQRS